MWTTVSRWTLCSSRGPARPRSYRHLEGLCSSRPNVSMVPPVPMTGIVPAINSYDIGLFLLEPTNFNYRYALPNKLFEFVQARLAVAIGPSPEMARLVRQFGCGVVADSFLPQDLAARLNALSSDEIVAMKRNAAAAAGPLAHEETMRRFDRLLEEVCPC